MNQCLAKDCRMGGLGCDNMTVVIVCYLNGESYEKLAEKCKSSLLIKVDSTQCLNNNNPENNCSKELNINSDTDTCLSVTN